MVFYVILGEKFFSPEIPQNQWTVMLQKFHDHRNTMYIYGLYNVQVIMRNFYTLTVEKNISFEDAQKNPDKFVKTVETYFSNDSPDFYKQFCYMTTAWHFFKCILNEYLSQKKN